MPNFVRFKSLFARLTGFQLFGSGVSWVPGVAVNPVQNEPGVRTEARKVVAEPTEPVSHEPDKLDRVLERGHRQVLIALARSRDSCLDIEQITKRIRSGRTVALHYLEVLEQFELIEDGDGDGLFELTPQGRAYLVRERLVR